MSLLRYSLALAKDVVIGRYQLLSVLGRGGMGSVWNARHVDWGTPAAVKRGGVHTPAMRVSATDSRRFDSGW